MSPSNRNLSILLSFIIFSSFLSPLTAIAFPKASQPTMLSKLRHTLGTGIATTQFFLYGKIHFTRTGYERHVQKYDSPVQPRADICRGAEGADGVDLGGKTIVVTGYVRFLH